MENKEKNFMSAVIYVYNAQDRIEKFLEMLLKVLKDNFEHSEIICVNDCSKDGSVEKIKQVCRKVEDINVSILNMSYFHGMELAMNAGMELAIGDFVFEFDVTESDFDAKEIMKIYKRSLEGYDIVSAVPEKNEKFASRCFYKIFEWFADMPFRLHTESFRVLSRRGINRINSMNKTVLYRKAVYANCGLKTDSVIYKSNHMVKSDGKTDRWEKKYRMRLAVDAIVYRSRLLFFHWYDNVDDDSICFYDGIFDSYIFGIASSGGLDNNNLVSFGCIFWFIRNLNGDSEILAVNCRIDI